MRNYADEDYLHARIYAMRGRLLTLRDYASLVRDQQASFLKSRDPVEAGESVFCEQIAPIIAVAESCGKYAPLFRAFFRQFETHNAKILLAKAFGRKTPDVWYDTAPFASLKKELLEKNLSAEEVKTLITQTFSGVDFKNTGSFLRMAINLDISAAKNFYDSSAMFSREARREFQEMALQRAAVLSVIWARRLKDYYHLSEEQIPSYIDKIINLFDGDVQPYVRNIEAELNSYLERIRKSAASEPSVIDIEKHLEQDYYAWVSFMFHRDFHSVYCVVSYLWFLYYQIKNLFRVIDGRRFGMSDESILNKIICDR